MAQMTSEEYNRMMALYKERNKKGLCIHTGRLDCEHIIADEGCFRCMDPYEADLIFEDTKNG